MAMIWRSQKRKRSITWPHFVLLFYCGRCFFLFCLWPPDGFHSWKRKGNSLIAGIIIAIKLLFFHEPESIVSSINCHLLRSHYLSFHKRKKEGKMRPKMAWLIERDRFLTSDPTTWFPFSFFNERLLKSWLTRSLKEERESRKLLGSKISQESFPCRLLKKKCSWRWRWS